MRKQETFAIYGGTFSPPHLGHVHAAEAFYNAIAPDRLLIIPSAIPPHKAPVLGAQIEDRLAMCRIAFSHIPQAEISEIEIFRSGKSYTVDTLRALEAENRRIVMLVGTDMFLTLDSWYCAEEIFARAEIALIRRESNLETLSSIQEKLEVYRRDYGAIVHFVDILPFEISSTELRGRIAKGESVSGLLPNDVEAYIKKCHLYQS